MSCVQVRHAGHLGCVGACSPALAHVLPLVRGVSCPQPSSPATLTQRRQVLAGRLCAAGTCRCPGCSHVLWQHNSDDPKPRSPECLGCSLPVLLGAKASWWSWDPWGAGGNACCALRSWDGGLPAQQPAPHFYQTLQRVILFALKSNKCLNVENLAFLIALFLYCSQWWTQPTLHNSHRLETSSLSYIFIARTETSTQGSAQHRHGTSWGGLPGWLAPPWHMRIVSAP